jgi:hypothetical protein
VERLAFIQKFYEQPNACIAGHAVPLAAKVANGEVGINPSNAFAVHASVEQATDGGYTGWSSANDSPFKLRAVLLC